MGTLLYFKLKNYIENVLRYEYFNFEDFSYKIF